MIADDSLKLFDKCSKDGPHHLICSFFSSLSLQVQVKKISDALHSDIIVIIIERREGVLKNIRSMRQEYQGQHSLLHPE